MREPRRSHAAETLLPSFSRTVESHEYSINNDVWWLDDLRRVDVESAWDFLKQSKIGRDKKIAANKFSLFFFFLVFFHAKDRIRLNSQYGCQNNFGVLGFELITSWLRICTDSPSSKSLIISYFIFDFCKHLIISVRKKILISLKKISVKINFFLMFYYNIFNCGMKVLSIIMFFGDY